MHVTSYAGARNVPMFARCTPPQKHARGRRCLRAGPTSAWLMLLRMAGLTPHAFGRWSIGLGGHKFGAPHPRLP
jgi:hypothetical protein